MSFETTGKLIEAYPTTAVNDKFKKREFIIEMAETKNGYDFKDFIKFQLTQDKCAILDAVKVGETIKVSFNLRGRKWEKDGTVSYFTNLEAWKIESLASGTKSVVNDAAGFPDASQALTNENKEFTASSEDVDDLPF